MTHAKVNWMEQEKPGKTGARQKSPCHIDILYIYIIYTPPKPETKVLNGFSPLLSVIICETLLESMFLPHINLCSGCISK